MTLIVNGAPTVVPDSLTLGAFMSGTVVARSGSTRGKAAAVDGDVIPRSTWDLYPLRDGQTVEVISAMQGG